MMEAFAANRQAIEREPLPPNVGALLDQAVARYGERPFWVSVDDGVSLSYRRFAQRVERCAAALAGFGVGRATHVAVMLPNIPAFAITWIALARLAAVMVPVNTRFTSRELEYVLAQSDAEVLVIDREYLEILHKIDAATPPVPRGRTIVHGGSPPGFPHDWDALVDAAPPGRATDGQADTDDLLTIQYTSGSTGFPKGCMLTHRYWTIIGRVRARHSAPVQRMMLDMPFYYMGGQWRLLMALYLGGHRVRRSTDEHEPFSRSPGRSSDRLLYGFERACKTARRPPLCRPRLDLGRVNRLEQGPSSKFRGPPRRSSPRDIRHDRDRRDALDAD